MGPLYFYAPSRQTINQSNKATNHEIESTPKKKENTIIKSFDHRRLPLLAFRSCLCSPIPGQDDSRVQGPSPGGFTRTWTRPANCKQTADSNGRERAEAEKNGPTTTVSNQCAAISQPPDERSEGGASDTSQGPEKNVLIAWAPATELGLSCLRPLVAAHGGWMSERRREAGFALLRV